MASCSGNGSRGHHKFTLNVNETSTNTTNNTSTVSWSFVLSPIQTGWNWNISGISYSINVDGNVKNGTISSYNGSSTVTIASGTKTITHNNDGSKSISFSFNVTDSAGKTYTPGNASGSGNMTLTKINRFATTTSATDFNDETNPTITFSNPANYSLQPYLNFYINGILAKTIYRNKGSYSSPYTWVLTNEERDELRELLANINSCTVNEGVDTYNGNTKLGYSSIGKTFSIINANPVFEDFDYEDTNSTVTNITGDNQIIIKGLSNLQVNIPVADKMTALKYATETKYVATIDTLNGTVNYSDENDVIINLGNVANNGTKRLSVRAYDSRNNSTEVYKDIIVYDYIAPTINVSASRENNFENNTTISVSGTYSPLTINSVDKNTISSVQYRYREIESTWSSWINMTKTASGGNYSITDTVVSLDNTKEFEIEIKVIDSFNEVTATTNVDIGVPIFFINTSDNNCYVGEDKVLTEADINENYITTEVDTGKRWINGEIIYRKVLEINPTSDSDFYAHDISNFSQIIHAYGRCTRSTGTAYQQIIPCNYTNWEIWIYDFTDYNFKLKFSSNQWAAGVDDIYIVLEYIKTSN